MVDKIGLVIWLIVGIMIFAQKQPISKLQYWLCWFCLILQLVVKIAS